MSIARLLVTNFRNLANQSIEFDPNLNFVVGDNGSGKSSLLESVFFLGHGKSYRTSKIDNLATFGLSEFIINVKNYDGNNLGISKCLANQQTLIKFNGEKLVKLSELAKNIAVQIVTPESFKLFFGGPKERRKFFDLGLFHVKHDFSAIWKDFSRVLKQRNACLRQGVSNKDLYFWDQKFCELSNVVNQIRIEYVNLFTAELSHWLGVLLPDIANKIELNYLKGWSKSKSIEDVLLSNKERERATGFSLYGAHKFDIKFLIQNEPLEFKLSRGQQKLFLLALTFTQAKLIERVNRVKPILLIDDIGAELDTSSRTKLSNAVKLVDCQVIVSAIDKVALEPLVPNNNKYKVFHVEHGNILEVNRLSYDSRK